MEESKASRSGKCIPACTGFFVSQIVIRGEPTLSENRLRLSYIGWQAVVRRILVLSVAEP